MVGIIILFYFEVLQISSICISNRHLDFFTFTDNSKVL